MPNISAQIGTINPIKPVLSLDRVDILVFNGNDAVNELRLMVFSAQGGRE